MFHKSINYVWILLIVFLKIRVYNAQIAQAVNNTSSNKEPTTSVNTKFADFGSGYPNTLQPGLYRNSPNNYPRNPLLYGNQNNNMRGPQQGYDWNPQYPSQGYFSEKPHQLRYINVGDPGYSMPRFGRNTFGPDFNSGFNPNYYQRPNVNRPGNGYPGYISRPYQNGRLPNQGGLPNRPSGLPADTRYFPQGGHPPQSNFQSNPNLTEGDVASNLRPNYPDNLKYIPDTNVQFPGSNIQDANQANQYPRENGLGNQGNLKIRPNQNNNNNYPSYSSYNMPGNNMQHSPNSNENNDGPIQFPYEDSVNQMPGNNNPPGAINLKSNMNGTPQSQLPNNQQFSPVNGPNANDTEAIFGKPVFAPSVTSSPGQPTYGGQ